MKKTFLTTTPWQTKKLGKNLARKILKIRPQKRSHLFPKAPLALIFGLEGDLGGGKTTFLQGLAKGLGIKEKILSPTFVIFKKFKIQKSNFKYFHHIDCYRIKKPKEILDLGFKEIISNPQNIVAVEWADHIRKVMPKNTIWISFEFINKNKRKIIIKNDYRKETFNHY